MQGKVKIDPKAWINRIAAFFKNFKNLPRDEQVAWGFILLGIVFIIIGLVI